MADYFGHLESEADLNKDYRRVVSTTDNLQLVLMSLEPNEEIGMEVHPHTTQFIRVERGIGYAEIDGQFYNLRDGSAVVIPPGAEHNIVATSAMKLYTIYSPPEHRENTVQATKPVGH